MRPVCRDKKYPANLIFNYLIKMENRNLINTLYKVETILKVAFLAMSLLNMPFTLLVAFASSAIGVFRVCKSP